MPSSDWSIEKIRAMKGLWKMSNVEVLSSEGVQTLSELCSLEMEEFLNHFEGKDLGYVRSTRVVISSMYDTARKVKDDLIAKREESDYSEEYVDCIKKAYSVLMDLEEKYFALKTLEEGRKALI